MDSTSARDAAAARRRCDVAIALAAVVRTSINPGSRRPHIDSALKHIAGDIAAMASAEKISLKQ
jgi:hypothetical protein